MTAKEYFRKTFFPVIFLKANKKRFICFRPVKYSSKVKKTAASIAFGKTGYRLHL